MFKWVPSPQNDFKGSGLSIVIMAVIAGFTLVRGCIHIFWKHGGADTMGGFPLSNPGGEGIIHLFAIMGSYQIILALGEFLVLFRYRRFTSLIYILVVLEQSLFAMIWWVKPIANQPSGHVFSLYVFFPLSILGFLLSLKRQK